MESGNTYCSGWPWLYSSSTMATRIASRGMTSRMRACEISRACDANQRRPSIHAGNTISSEARSAGVKPAAQTLATSSTGG